MTRDNKTGRAGKIKSGILLAGCLNVVGLAMSCAPAAPTAAPNPTVQAAATQVGGAARAVATAQGGIAQPTTSAAQTQVVSSAQGAATALAPTVSAVKTEIAPTVAAA